MSEQNNEELNTQTQLETTTSIAKIDMRDALAESFSSYAREVIMDRALPDLRDGLLPVQRRIIYAMNESRYTHTKPMVKSAKIVGEVMGKYHAHGDCIDRGTLVYLDTGEVRSIGDLYEETLDDPNKTYGIYAVDAEGKLVRATLSDVRIGQYADEVYHITLSNGYTLKVTSNHPFLAYNQEWIKAEDLTVNTPLFNARLYDDLGYPKVDDDFKLIITDIQIEQTKQRPMYDFTVEGVANALFVASSDNQTFVSLHNSSIYGAMVRQSQDWIVGNPLIDFQGNNGSIDGDGAASMRYTEARLSKSAKYLLEGLHKQGVVDWVKNYDDTLEEPVFLPAQYPNILVQGVKGISVGYATDIPPHNLKEILESCILLIDDPTLTYSKLKVKGPDLPTGGTIVNGKDLAKLYSTGAGSVKVRGNFRIEQANKRSKLRQIVFYEIPYGTNKPDIVGQIKDLLDDKQLNGVRDVRDESGSEGIRLVVEIDRDANSEVLTEILFKKTALESRVNVNCVMISGKKPKLMPLVDILNEFNEFRLETVRKELLADNQVDLNRSHILEGLLILSQHTDAIIKLVKESQGKSDARDQLIAQYSLSEVQANAILELQIHRMSRVSQDEYQDELNRRQEQINQRNMILNDDELLKYEVKNGYQSIIDDLGTSIKRKTKVVRDVKDVDITVNNLIQQEQVAVGIDEEGNLKRSTLRSYHATESKGNEFTLLTDTHKHVLIWTSHGNYVYYPVFNIKEGRWGDEGPNITSYGIKLEPDERIIGISEHDPDAQVLVIRNTGRGKVSNAKDLEMARINNIYSLGGVRTNEEVSYVGLVKGDEAIEIVTSRYVKKDKTTLYERLVFNLSDLEPIGVKAGGRSLVKIAKSKTLERVTIVEPLDTSADDIGGSTKDIETKTVIPNNVYNQQPQFFIDESLLAQTVEEDVDDEGLEDCEEQLT